MMQIYAQFPSNLYRRRIERLSRVMKLAALALLPLTAAFYRPLLGVSRERRTTAPRLSFLDADEFFTQAQEKAAESIAAAPESSDSLARGLLDVRTAEESEAAIVNGLSSGVASLRQAANDLFPSAASFPSLPSAATTPVGELRGVLATVIQQERVIGVVVLVAALAFSVIGGIRLGDRSRPPEKADDARVWKGVAGDGARTFRTGLAPTVKEAFDQGGSAERETRRSREDFSVSQTEMNTVYRTARRQVSTGLWVELLLCVLLDVAGDASLFYPIGELTDVPFAFLSALVVELFFDWPELATVALWEELLPFTDAFPTATLGWLCVVILGLRPAVRETPPILRGPIDLELFSTGVRPPVGDRASYQPPEPHLRVGSRPWEE